MTTVESISAGRRPRRRSIGRRLFSFWYEIEEYRSYVAMGTGIAAALIMLIVQALSGKAPVGFFPVMGMLITWSTYIAIGVYVLLSIPVVADLIKSGSVRAVVMPALFIPAGMFVSWLASTRIGIPVFNWIVHDVMKEITAREMAEKYYGLCLQAAMTVGALSVLLFCGRVGTFWKWPKALLITAAVSAPASLIPRIGTCIIFGISMSILLGLMSKLGGLDLSDCASSYSSSSAGSSVSEPDYHRMKDLVRTVHKNGGSKGLSIDEYNMYKEAVQNGSFSGRDMEYMAEGMVRNNSGCGYTRTDEQLFEDAERLW